jgi:putative transposase
MARSFRFAPEEYYHIYHRGVEGRETFADDTDFRRFLTTLFVANSGIPLHRSDLHYKDEKIFATEKETSLVNIGAYALMSNHFHLLVHEHSEGGTSTFMQKLMTAYTMYFNERYAHRGPLFSGRFHAAHVGSDNYLKYLYAYIHLNPLSIGFPKWKTTGRHPSHEWKDYLTQYKYSSLPDYLDAPTKRGQSRILTPEAFPRYFENGDAVLDDLAEWVEYAKLVKVQP